MLDNIDLLVVGAGPAGCVVAERAATILDWNVAVIERRGHIAGNCYDSLHQSGVLVHNYGPHYFRTSDLGVYKYLSRFTAWTPADYVVKSSVGGKLYPFPINLTTLEKFFNTSLDADSARELLDEKRLPIAAPCNSEEFVLSRVGQELYEAFYLNYTIKQWGLHPSELDPSVCGRVPIRFNRDERYVDADYQVMPAKGFTALFTRMLQHRKIRVLLDCDFQRMRRRVHPRHATLYTGPLDAYFEECFGPLPYRSLEFDFVEAPVAHYQPCVQINYPNEHYYTRCVEIKHVTRQQHEHTVLCYELPRAGGEPYYPVPMPESRRLCRRYEGLAAEATRSERVYFCGRLAQYRYFNTDQVVREALRCFERIRLECAAPRAASASLFPQAA